MKYIGYNRTSTKEQHLDRGDINIKEYCNQNNIPIKKIYTDKLTGKNFNRPRYIVMKEDVLEPGDILIISEVDRLGRNKKEILKELQYYKDNNIRVMILELPTTLINFSQLGDELANLLMETVNNMLIEMYASLAEAEMHKRERRQREGIEAMKARGEWNKYGRPKVMDADVFTKEYEKVLRGEQRPVDVIKKLSMKKATYYLYRKQYENNKEES